LAKMPILAKWPNRIRLIQKQLLTCHFSGSLTRPLNSALCLNQILTYQK
jgi:hypothetical protein